MALPKTKTNQMDSSGFTKQEMEAALLLIQLSRHDHNDHLSGLKSHCNNKHNEDLHTLIKDLNEQKKQKRKKSEMQDEHIQELDSGGSMNYNNNNYSDAAATSGTIYERYTVTKFFKKDRNEEAGEDNDDDDDEEEKVVAYGMKRRIKKYRSLAEIYSITKPLESD